MTSSGDPLIGRVLEERYRLDARLGAGASAVVYRAQQLRLGRDVAVKILDPTALPDDAARTRFEREARVLAELRHPNTVTLLDYGVLDEHRPFLVMELLDGSPLSECLDEDPLETDDVLAMLHQLSGALAEAHAAGVVHRDLKPANIVVEEVAGARRFRVLDFGIARVAGGGTATAKDKIVGTPAYMSPEQARGEAATPASDLYSLGVVAFEALAGFPPFAAESPVSLLLKHVEDDPPALAPLLADRPKDAGVAALVHRLLSKDPTQRPASAKSLATETEALLRRPEGEPPVVAAQQRPPTLLILAGLAGAVTAAAALWPSAPAPASTSSAAASSAAASSVASKSERAPEAIPVESAGPTATSEVVEAPSAQAVSKQEPALPLRVRTETPAESMRPAVEKRPTPPRARTPSPVKAAPKASPEVRAPGFIFLDLDSDPSAPPGDHSSP